MHKSIAAIGLILACCSSQSALADEQDRANQSMRAWESALPIAPLAGAADPAFRDAVILWLNGDDSNALPALANLANADNLAAQIFLGVIDRRLHAETAWLNALGREQRNVIFRRPDSRFGTPWLSVAAGSGSRLAALLRGPEPEPDGRFTADPALELAELGEPWATASFLGVLLNQGQWAEVVRMADIVPAYDEQAMVWAAATHLSDPDSADLRMDGLQAIGADRMAGYMFLLLANPVDPAVAGVAEGVREFARAVVHGRDLSRDDAPYSDAASTFLDDWLAAADAAALLRTWCSTACPGEEAACAQDLYALLFGVHTLPYVTASPLETVVPQDVWLDTPRAMRVLDWNALGFARAHADPAATLAQLPLQACVKDRLARALEG